MNLANPRRRALIAPAAFLVTLAAASTAAAQMEWTGSMSDSWFVGSNWNPVGPPSSTDDVVIDTVNPNATVIGVADADAQGVTVGDAGTGHLTVENGNTLNSSGAAVIGGQASAAGTVTVSGLGSSWTNSGGLRVGSTGTGALNIEAGGAVSNYGAFVGYLFGTGDGTVTVTGNGSAWNNAGELRVAQTGPGRVFVEDGATLNSTDGVIGVTDAYGPSVGEVTVTGSGSAWNYVGELSVGRLGNGTLTIADGGQVANAGFANAWIGEEVGSEGVVTVTGGASGWDTGSSLYVGQYGIGTLDITGNSTVSNAQAWIGSSAEGEGTVSVSGFGSHWISSESLVVGGFGTGTLNIGEDATVSAGEGVSVADQPDSEGTLLVNGVLSAVDGTTINTGGWLGGAGSIGGGATTIAGTVAPGSSVGTLSTRDLVFEPTALLEFELDDPGGTNDSMFANGDLTLDGTLYVTDLGGFGEGTYILIEYTGTLTDNTLAIGSLPAGFTTAIDTATAGEVRLEVEALPDDVFSDRFEG